MTLNPSITLLRMFTCIKSGVGSQESGAGSQESGVSIRIYDILKILIVKIEKSELWRNFKELLAYKKAFALAMKIFNLSKSFPSEELYSLTSQIRRSSRPVCANIAEAYRRRRFENYYISKLNDAETENSETDVWLDFAMSCLYISK